MSLAHPPEETAHHPPSSRGIGKAKAICRIGINVMGRSRPVKRVLAAPYPSDASCSPCRMPSPRLNAALEGRYAHRVLDEGSRLFPT